MIWKKQPVGSKLSDLQNNKASKDTATQNTAGLMSASDKTKLDGIATGATAVSVVDNLNSDSTTSALSAAQGKALNSNRQDKLTITDNTSSTAIANNAYIPTNRTVRNAIYNGLDKSSGAGFALDARQGYYLAQRKIQYHTLMENSTTSSYVSRNLMNSRKFSDYEILFFEFYRESWMVGSAIIARSQFASSTGIAVVTYWDSTKIEFDAKYVSDTSISVKEITSDSAGTNHYMRVRGMKFE